jgi:ABC-type multidrug transport system ATPase subunit
MTVWENLQWFLGMRGLTDKEIKDYADKWLPKVDMKKKLHDFVGYLSGGQKRKL